jgi:FMN phosphatase YigB (HAD superfamily)
VASLDETVVGTIHVTERARYSRESLSSMTVFCRRFRALSLDLWFTALYYSPERDDQWKEDRARLLRDALRARDGHGIGVKTVEGVMDSVHAQLRAQGREPITVDPEMLIPLYADALNAELTLPLDEFARAYSWVGLDEHPPIANPEAVSVVHALTKRGIPVITVTNTARRGATWQEYLRDRMKLEFRHVVASCDCGTAKPDPAIFQEAARRLSLETHELLHVGDRWELDVEGAQAAGLGAALYIGLWRCYPEGLYPATDPQRTDGSTVPRIERLEDLLSDGLFT